MNDIPHVIVVVEGGIVQEVSSTMPITIEIFDFDLSSFPDEKELLDHELDIRDLAELRETVELHQMY
jgi:hypothetical protein